MRLMTKELERKLPELGTTEKMDIKDVRIYAHYFSIKNNWDWYACEYDSKTGEFYGLVDGFEKELGGWTMADFESVSKGTIERDLYFDDTQTLTDFL